MDIGFVEVEYGLARDTCYVHWVYLKFQLMIIQKYLCLLLIWTKQNKFITIGIIIGIFLNNLNRGGLSENAICILKRIRKSYIFYKII